MAELEKNPTLTGENTNSFWAFDNGLEYILDEEKQFIIIVMTIQTDYFEET